MKKRLLSILLAAVMLLSALPLGLVDTAEAAAVSSGQCGNDIRWVLDDRGTLSITGAGKIYDYGYVWNGEEWEDIPTPWFGLRDQIRKVVVGKGVTYIGTEAFGELYNLTSVSLPAGLEGLGADVFRDCEKLTSVTIPDGVRYASGDLFSGCRSLKTVSLPDSLQGLGGATFLRCTSLTKVTLPRRLNQVTWHMFYGCTALTTVTLPGGIQEISEGAFSGCKALSTVHFGGSKAGWQAVTVRPDNDALKRAKVDYATTTLLPAPKLTGSVNRYGELTLNWTAVKGADSYEVFCAEKFRNSWQYHRCDWVGGSQTSLSHFQHEAGETYIYKIRAMDKNGTTGICSNEYTFTYNPTGPGVTGSDSGRCGANAMWTLDASGTLTISGTGAMYDYDFIGERNPAPWCADGLNNRVRTVVVKKGITELGYNAFAECPQLEKVTLPSGLKRIGSCAFIGCYSLPELTIPATVTTIESNAFTLCNSIKTLTLPGGLKKIGDAACSQMNSLCSVTLGKGITRLSPYMFNMCYELTSVTIPEGVTDIGNFAFRYCENLQTLRLPATVTSIGNYAFGWCDSLTDVYYGGTKTDWAKITIADGNEDLLNATLHAKTAAPATVKLVGAKAVDGGIRVTWQKAAGAAQYRVYRKDAPNSGWKVLTSSATGTSYVDKTAVAGVKYTYTVRGIAKDGKTISPSFDGNGVSATAAPANVTLTGAKLVNGGIQVTWQKADGAVKYRVYRKDTANTGWKVLTSSATGTSYVDKTAKAGVKYTYTVRGIAKDGKTLSPGFDGIGVSATTAPAIVTLTGAKAVNGGITVTWQKADGVAKYRVFRKAEGETKWKGITNVSGTSYTDTSVQPGVKYTYTVRGIAADGKTISPSYDGTGVSATAAPATVTLTGAKAVNSDIQVTWQKADGAVKYRVYRKDTTNTGWTVLTSSATGTSYTDETAKPGVKYTYTVRGIAKDGKTLSSDYNRTGVSATAAPAFVTLTDAKAASGSITVTWNKADGAVKYRVYRKAEGETKWTGIANVSGTSYTDTTVKSNMMYCYTVRGIAADGTLSPSYDRYGIGTTAFTEIARGKCGANLTWTLTSDNTLTISGKGAMYDYGTSSGSGGVTPPWIAAGYRNAVSYVRIETGVTYVGQNAFADCSSITDVSFPYTLEEIGNCAFQNCTMLYSLFLPYKTVSTGNSSTITAPSLIGNAAFRGCVRLRSVYLPVTIKAIGTSAFADCNALSDVGYTGSESDWEAISIGDGNIPLTTANIRYNVSYSSPKTG